MIMSPMASLRAHHLFPSLLDLGCGRHGRHAFGFRRRVLDAPWHPLPCLLCIRQLPDLNFAEESETYGTFSVQFDSERVFSPRDL
jgi:hypothetical protein